MRMQPSIFGKNLQEVDFDDVVAFCNQQPKEGLGLDYKKDLSSIPNIVKALVSFANTNGGWLIIGVEDDGNDKPKLPIHGMQRANDLTQRINNSIISSVSPIVLPYYKECVSKDGKSEFLIVHMPQSTAAPHFMEYKNKHVLFIRIADRASGQDWEDYASSSQWELLRNRRAASVAIREELLKQMKSVYGYRAFRSEREIGLKEALEGKIANTFGSLVVSNSSPRDYYNGAQTLILQPAYPTEQITGIDTLSHMITYEPIDNGINRFRAQTPDHRGHDTKIYQNGSYVFHTEEGKKGKHYFFGLDVFGNLMCVDPIELSRLTPNKDRVYFTDLRMIIMSIVGTLKFANKAYDKMGLIGNLILRIEFKGHDGCCMYFPEVSTAWPWNENNPPENVTGSYWIEKELNTVTFNNPELFQSLIASVSKEILFSFNYPTIDDAALLLLIKQAAKNPVEI